MLILSNVSDFLPAKQRQSWSSHSVSFLWTLTSSDSYIFFLFSYLTFIEPVIFQALGKQRGTQTAKTGFQGTYNEGGKDGRKIATRITLPTEAHFIHPKDFTIEHFCKNYMIYSISIRYVAGKSKSLSKNLNAVLSTELARYSLWLSSKW